MSEPFFNETFWILYQPQHKNSDFAIKDIIHYNSLEDDIYLYIPELTPAGAQLTFVPEGLIDNYTQELKDIVETHKQILIDNQITFVKHIDGHKWVVHEMLLKIVRSANDFKV